MLNGNAGTDTIDALDGGAFVDRLDCGPNSDSSTFDTPQDIVAGDCG